MNPAKNPEILGIGNSIVDVIIDINEDVLDSLQLQKGSMRLCDIEFQQKIIESFTDFVTVPGGSLANTMTTLGALGISCSFSSLVGKDDFGDTFKSSMSEMKVETKYIQYSKNHTGKSIILVTPDGERTMNTHLGACETYGTEQIDAIDTGKFSHIFIEGYLIGSDKSYEAIEKLISKIDSSNTKIIITLSDSFCVTENLDRFKKICSLCSMIFANEKEFQALIGKTQNEHLPTIITEVGISPSCELVITKSGEGCLVVKGKEVSVFPTEKNQSPIDLTGAGDQFASAFLFGTLQNWTLEHRANFANFLAGSIISQTGPRFSLNDLKAKVDNFK